MLSLSIGKKFEFAGAHKLWHPDWSSEQNQTVFGVQSEGLYGHGHNFELMAWVTGTLQEDVGMIIELSQLKSLLNETVMGAFDHRYLNDDRQRFLGAVPTCGAINAALFESISPIVETQGLTLVQTNLTEDSTHSARQSAKAKSVFYTCELPSLVWLGASFGPEFTQLGLVKTVLEFDVSRDRLVVSDQDISVEYGLYSPAWKDAVSAISTQGLSWLSANRAMSQSDIIRYYWELVNAIPSIQSIRSISMSFPTATITYSGKESAVYCFKASLVATHCIGLESNSNDENVALFAKCANQHGHGFDFEFELTHSIDDLDFSKTVSALIQSGLEPFQYRSLDQEIPLFRGQLCTCELMISKFHSHFESILNYPIQVLRLQETANNQFEIRRA